ncbi:CRISPR-associated helicase Cas3' [Micromonospora sp. WMMD882]|uniref:CRISPR-associated helicase Cas3' n=1 Tax=Micromonospora sp. WMMD882 TaxID=3015151 RepID=UPI00248B2EDA|nr:CRISPR-associated helicase Cas3' [Micromonospora sp. WMMD882]WBB78157.1 CRISPR-associated helicase Cas3' [Micromonospora sp. WMMD882]
MSVDVPLWAHSPAPGTDVWHSLEDHLRGTAELARRFATPFGGGDLAYWFGLLHDCGKASDAWQQRLAEVAGTDGRVGIDHKAFGARLAYERGLGMFSIGIFGHHGGLLDAGVFRARLKEALAKAPENIASAERALTRLLPELPADLSAALPELWRTDPLVGEMALRLCYSALVDADGLDTHAHHHQLPAPRVRPDADFDHLAKRYEQRRAELLAERPRSPIDGLREQVYAGCLAAADRERGIFRLHAPTGVGKTLAAGGFALRHAARHGLRRVVVAVPFLTITEQNAAVYRDMLDEDGVESVVLEHHSQVDFDGAAGRWGRQAAENWDAPFVVTTFVRLFESLYARKPSAMRRVHRLAGSVIVLDEIQALPHEMLVPILDGLRLLVEHFGTTVLLSSATQPDFWALRAFQGFDRFELVADVPALTERLRRVTYEWRLDPAPTLADIADEAVVATTSGDPRTGTAMVVVNITADARTVYQRWQEEGLGDVARHLSTRMCPAHRRRVLAEVTERLRTGRPVLLATTQLVEAGVDLDFPVVYRAMAPADSLLQAAGRANREGRIERGRVIVFDPSDGGRPPAYQALVGVAADLFGPGKADPDDDAALTSYYRRVYQALNLEDRAHVGQLVQQARRKWEFETVTDGPPRDGGASARNRDLAFRLIRDEGISVVTPQGAETEEQRTEIEELAERIRNAPVPDLRDLRRLQPYTTTVHSGLLRDPVVKAWMRPILGDQVRVGGLVEWIGDYDPATGITSDPMTERFVL